MEGPKTRRQCNLLSAQSQKGQHSYFPPTLRQKYHSYSSLKSLPAGQIKKIIKILCSFLQTFLRILIGPAGPAKITLPQSLTPSEYPRSIHPRSALQFAFYILVYNSQASAFLFSADPLSLRLSPPFCLFTALQREPLFTSSKEQNLPEKTRKRSFQSILPAPICWCPTSRLLRAAALLSQA